LADLTTIEGIWSSKNNDTRDLVFSRITNEVFHYLTDSADANSFLWDDFSLPDFVWSDGLYRAATHYLNDKGPCQTSGSIEGHDLKGLLDKYYTYNYTNLRVYEFKYDFATSDYLTDDTQLLAWEVIQHMAI